VQIIEKIKFTKHFVDFTSPFVVILVWSLITNKKIEVLFMNNNEKEIEISLKDILRIFKHGLWVILTTAVVFAIVAFTVSNFFLPKTYTSKVKLYVETTKKGDSSYSDLSSYNYATSLVNTYVEMLQTNNFYEKVANNLDNKYTASQISSMLSFNNDSETEVFLASVVAGSPTEAKIVADSVASVAPGVISNLEDNAKLKIVDSATIPTSPTSPSVSKNTLLAFLVGFVLATIYVFVKDALDVKIKYDSDMVEIDQIPILSAIPDFHGAAVNITALFAEQPVADDAKTEQEGK
jgi:capsular polysaccharide biosynthesis protein